MATTNLSAYDKASIPNGKQFRFGIVVSEWNDNITQGLLEGAKSTLLEHDVQPENILVWDVPGSYELIYGSKKMIAQNVDAVIAIGSVIQGETKHFDFVCDAVAQGIKDLNVTTETPVIFCVLTDNTLQQAIDRSGGKHGNKGVEAAVAALKMATLRKNA
ncbi:MULTISPECIES: 6,7-dimethyl-8-ribityllumazine synthase [unclassified Olleya]|jgi:6,7-dimethyl-8-ribityllumazine synthase|uniref:6,7-dimethyl-8-ribityllumazine synthase n=1 Tax=unclassified Olleya TaxID=2615019 RepID=UPI0011A6BDDB|nr:MULTISPECIES: 6,7-dimethyl-8-ribityllumazine synthase [unclassified Olleya]TVZ47164.1 6,7-dimethyl-8-ribityllumazine synthase [Olleya sp. Hel_I_94]|tara:strand:- start:3429 stop:3908 length:480 start_codon:yes stop_codon:yes gene_type:complete